MLEQFFAIISQDETRGEGSLMEQKECERSIKRIRRTWMLMAKPCRTCCAESACVSCRNFESRVSLLPQDAVPVSLKSRKDRRTSVRAPAAEVRGPRRRQLTKAKRVKEEVRSEKRTFVLQVMVQLKTFTLARQIDERIAEQQSTDPREKKNSL